MTRFYDVMDGTPIEFCADNREHMTQLSEAIGKTPDIGKIVLVARLIDLNLMQVQQTGLRLAIKLLQKVRGFDGIYGFARNLWARSPETINSWLQDAAKHCAANGWDHSETDALLGKCTPLLTHLRYIRLREEKIDDLCGSIGKTSDYLQAQSEFTVH